VTSGSGIGRPQVALIAAVARNGVIGDGKGLLWHLPEDLAHFRRVTTGCPVIMGRKTWDSLPDRFRPLPGRRNIVVTRQPGWQATGAEPAGSLDAAIALCRGVPKVFVIGGAQLYAAALPLADELVLTEIGRDYEGEARFPAWERAAFEEISREAGTAAGVGGLDFAFVRYARRA
jgi:dihydrofolate reductase